MYETVKFWVRAVAVTMAICCAIGEYGTELAGAWLALGVCVDAIMSWLFSLTNQE